MNQRATELVDAMVEEASLLRVRSHTLDNGARIIDAGVEAEGGFGAGLALAEICMGGLGDLGLHHGRPRQAWPAVLVSTDHPAISCMASQYAGWAVSVDKFFAMGSGPLRAHARVEKELFEKLGLPGGGRARRAGARGPHPARCGGGGVGGGEGRPHAGPAQLRRRADREPRRRGADLGPDPGDRACTRWRRSASTCGGW